MKETLEKIRKPKTLKGGTAVSGALIALLLGLGLGVFAKWLDIIGIDRIVTWKHLLEKLAFARFFADIPVWLVFALALAVYSYKPWQAGLNVLAMGAGMCGSVYLNRILFPGASAPSVPMTTLYLVCAAAAVAALIVWYAKGKSIVSLILGILIMALFWLLCFRIGLFYIKLNGILNILVFLGAVGVLWKDWKISLASVAGGLVVAGLVCNIWPLY